MEERIFFFLGGGGSIYPLVRRPPYTESSLSIDGGVDFFFFGRNSCVTLFVMGSLCCYWCSLARAFIFRLLCMLTHWCARSVCWKPGMKEKALLESEVKCSRNNANHSVGWFDGSTYNPSHVRLFASSFTDGCYIRTMDERFESSSRSIYEARYVYDCPIIFFFVWV